MRGAPRPCGPVLVVDDDESVRGAVSDLLEQAGYAALQAATGEDARELAESETPALVVLDVCLPGVSGYQVCRDLRERFGTGLPIVFISGARTESYDRVAGLLVGGDEYFSKPICPDEFMIRVARLISRSTPLNPDVTERLTNREYEVLRLLADGKASSEIATVLFITPKTVATHVDHILRKLGVSSRAQAIALAYRRDLVHTH
jgi:two-component system alkaline phosphatase synthesis response regulator PhoP